VDRQDIGVPADIAARHFRNVDRDLGIDPILAAAKTWSQSVEE